MKSLTVMLLMLSAANAFATGPIVSGGPSATENLVSKRKISAVLNAITDVNDAIESVRLDDGKVLYIAKVRNGSVCSESYYRVEPDGSGMPAQFVANFVDLISSGDCQ